MDRLLWVALSGASETMLAQSVKANNLANVSTPGFRAALQQQRSMQAYGPGFPSRVFTGTEVPGYNFSVGGYKQTGKDLDVAIQGDGWIAVTGEDGKEGYTRRGDMQITGDGFLVNGAGQNVIGEGGSISMPPAEEITISNDGTIIIKPVGSEAGTSIVVDKIKLVNPDSKQLVKREDGLFENANGIPAETDVEVKVRSQVIEMSNVNAVGELVDLITLARKHELDIKMMKKAEENDQASARILQIT
jgi:flagellar basal-body rod protein FlgF